MLVTIERGFGHDAKSEKEQEDFLKGLMETLNDFSLPVSAISSEGMTGESIYLEVPNDLELREITRSLASFAEVLARQNQCDVYFDINIPDHSFNATIAGAA